mgnify:FL=1
MATFSPSPRETTRLPQVGQDGRPLTRRQKRELERAREAAASRNDAPGSPGRPRSVAEEPRLQPVPTAEGQRPRSVPQEEPQARYGPTGRAGQPAGPPRRAAPASVPAPPEAAVPAAVSPSAPSASSASSPAEPPTSTGAQRAIGAALGRPRPRGRVAVILAVIATVAIVAAPLVVARMWGGLTGTIGSSGAIPGGSISADGPLDTVLEVAGRVGSVPILSLKGRLAPATVMSTDEVVTGQGRVLSAGDAVLLSVAVFDGNDGTNTTGTATGTRLYSGTLDADRLGTDLANAVTGVAEGSRVVVRAPRTKDDQTRTTEITVIDILPTTATGTPQEPVAGMPTVTMNADGTVGLSVQGLPTPTHSTAAVLVQGDGPQVQASCIVTVRYSTVSWADGVQHATTYGTTTPPGTISMDNALAGIKEHLVDVQVGSRVVIAIPADQAAGEGAVAVVIDVLAVNDEEATGAADSAGQDPSGGPGTVHVTPGATPGTTKQ